MLLTATPLFKSHFLPMSFSSLISLALREDIGDGDVTSLRVIPESAHAAFSIRAREAMVMCGGAIAQEVFHTISPAITFSHCAVEGQMLAKHDALLMGQGPARAVMTAERVALNLLRQAIGVATSTREFVTRIEGTRAKILDTRKTIPGLRALQKYAVTVGGGVNHRFGLYDGILIKDNHIALSGSVAQAIAHARQGTVSFEVQVECDTLSQLREALHAGADRVLLDNMTLAELREAVALVEGRIPLEASGNVTLETVRAIAETGVDFISIGRITNAPKPVDIGLDV